MKRTSKATDPETEYVATQEIVPVDAVTSEGEIKETVLSAPPVRLDAGRFAQIESSLAQIKKMRTGISMNAKYREFNKEGDSVRGVFIGFRTIYKSDGGERKPLRAAAWIDEDKAVWINAGTALCSQCEQIPEGTPVEITYSESIKVEMGKVKIYDVKPLFF